MRTVHVQSSNGKDHYQVTIDDQGRATGCPCKGWEHRQHCRHLGEAEKLDAAERKKETAK